MSETSILLASNGKISRKELAPNAPRNRNPSSGATSRDHRSTRRDPRIPPDWPDP